jgi:ABC-2 type transport system permease protein
MGERIVPMPRKEFRPVLRDPRMRMVIFGLPIVQCLIFGYAVTMDVRHVRLVIIDRDNTPASRALITRFTGSDYFDAVAYTNDEARARALIDAAEASAILQINARFGAALAAGRAAPVQLLVDGSDSNTARLVLNYSVAIATAYGSQVMVGQALRLAGRTLVTGSVDLRHRAWFNENLESRNYIVPGIMAILVMLVSLMLTSMAIVREKEAGTIEQIMVTPIRPVEFILGKCLPFAVIGFIDVLLVTAVGVFWFDIPIRGSLLLLLFSTALFLMTTLGIGLFISTVSGTQQQAMMTTFFFFFPAMLLSGFIYPVANTPLVIQWITLANPLRHFLVIIRSIFLKGVGPDVLWPQMTALFVIGLGVLTFAVKRFHKTLT